MKKERRMGGVKRGKTTSTPFLYLREKEGKLLLSEKLPGGGKNTQGEKEIEKERRRDGPSTGIFPQGKKKKRLDRRIRR